MLPDIWEPDLQVLFVSMAVDETSDTLGFHHLHPRDRFWELLQIGGITRKPILSSAERKAMAEGHASGNLSDPVRLFFTQKKKSQLLQLGIGLTELNRRMVAVAGNKDKAARPTEEDVRQFLDRVGEMRPTIIALMIRPDLFLELFAGLYPTAVAALGPQPFTIGKAEAWLLDSPAIQLRGEALTKQEDAFFALGERLAATRSSP